MLSVYCTAYGVHNGDGEPPMTSEGRIRMSRSLGRSAEKLGMKELVAMGVGGMVGGGIFSVLGLSVSLSGHAAPVAFLLGGIIAFFTGLSYAKLGLKYRSDGGSFTYLEYAFENRNIAGLGGWLLIMGYLGTMALYSFTFAVYGSAMLGAAPEDAPIHHLLESGILALFLGVNLYGVKAAGETEDIIVMIKVIILGLFAVVGFFFVDSSNLLPVFDKGMSGLLMGAALIFVAYEGFELIPNAVREMKDPERDLPGAINISIVITTIIYITVALVAVGNLTPPEIAQYKEYALAVAAKPFLGHAGFLLIGLGALLSTASAINATMFGTARLAQVMAMDKELPQVFGHRERTKDIPWVSLLVITLLTLVFVNLGDLDIISSFSSATFLIIFASINLAALRLRRQISMSFVFPMAGFVLCMVSWGVLFTYLWEKKPHCLISIVVSYLVIASAEFLFSKRRIFFKGA